MSPQEYIMRENDHTEYLQEIMLSIDPRGREDATNDDWKEWSAAFDQLDKKMSDDDFDSFMNFLDDM